MKRSEQGRYGKEASLICEMDRTKRLSRKHEGELSDMKEDMDDAKGKKSERI